MSPAPSVRSLAAGGAPRATAVLAAEVVARLRAFDGPPDTGEDAARADLEDGPASDAGGLASGPTRIINATGVIVHTNLGRAAWPAAAIEAARRAAGAPLLLELDRRTGRRGARYRRRRGGSSSR